MRQRLDRPGAHRVLQVPGRVPTRAPGRATRIRHRAARSPSMCVSNLSSQPFNSDLYTRRLLHCVSIFQAPSVPARGQTALLQRIRASGRAHVPAAQTHRRDPHARPTISLLRFYSCVRP